MKWRPVKVLFVGDEPSSKNVSPDVPFVGTQSYKRLLKWIGELDLDINNIEIINAEDCHQRRYDKIIYLGQKAYMKDRDLLFDNANFEIIDHPSPRNRKINNPGYEKQMLKELKDWIYNG